MPIWLRKFTVNQIVEFRKEEKSEYDKASKKNNQTLVNSEGKVNAPEFMKASKPYQGKSNYK